MQAWQIPPIPSVAGRAALPQVFDTSTGALHTVGPTEGTARMYVCGITPYDATHMGHAATYVAFDVLNRAWRDAGLEVTYVQNITDVDDPLLERAHATNVDWQQLALREISLFKEDMTALNVIPPEHYIGAVESIPLVITWISALQAQGSVYTVDGDLYFRIHSDPSFGAIAHLGNDEMLRTFAERGGDPGRSGKEHPLDCLLWMQQRDGEPGWDSPFGKGRPGWHIECVAIALEHLGMSFDVQGGGSDLVFPHHEMGASQAVVATGTRPYAKAYLHTGMVGLHGEKMSKSKGNLVFVSKLRDSGIDPMAIRLALLDGHYRSDRDWTEHGLIRAADRLDRWRKTLEGPVGDVSTLVAAIRSAVSHDLNTPQALAAIDEWMSSATQHEGSYDNTAMALAAIDALLGVRV